jgi:two-component system, NarL family, invasion response regulator UvrY
MKVLLIEDHAIVRAGCARVLGTRPDIQVIEARTGAEGAAAAAAERPDLVILDLNLPDMRGLEVLLAIRAVQPYLKVIIFSMYEDPALVSRALEAGALGYVSKNDDPELLLEAIDNGLAGRTYLGHAVAQKMALASLTADPLTGLTERERRLIDLLGSARTLGEISADLDVSYRTTAALAARTRIKLGLRTNSALIKFAVERRREL